jgi:predicted esterase
MPGGVAALLALLVCQDAEAEKLKSHVRARLWADTPEARARAQRELEDLKFEEKTLGRIEFLAWEKLIREGPEIPAADPKQEHALPVAVRADRELRVLVTLPDHYQPKRAWPLLVVMGGGPTVSRNLAREQARTMALLWRRLTARQGWILAVIEDTVSVAEEGRSELRYETLRPEDFHACVEKVQARFNVHPLKVFAAGVSLGANYALQFAASRPDGLAGLLAVASEGESREHVVRNLQNVSVYVLVGTKDRNIRTIEGPRKLFEILRNLDIRAGYDEDPARGHDSFPDRYPEVLKWFENGPRNPWPRVVVRVPHEGLFPVARRVAWIEADSDQASLRAEVKFQDVSILAARARKVRVWLGDGLVDLDRDVVVTVNGKKLFEGKVTRSLKAVVESGARDRGSVAAAVLEFDVPLDRVSLEWAYKWTQTLLPAVRESRLPWWEHYARLTLGERRPRPGLEGEKLGIEDADAIKIPEGLTGVRVTRVAEGSLEARAGLREGDILTGFGDEVFFRDGLGISLIGEWLFRRPELPASYEVSLLREGKPARLVVPLR